MRAQVMAALTAASSIMLAVAAASAAPDAGVGTAGCGNSITGSVSADHAPSDRLVLGRVWLPNASALLTWPRPPNLGLGNARFLKHGLGVTAGLPVTLQVPASMRTLYALYFNSSATTIAAGETEVRVAPCPDTQSPWTVWAGGYLANHPACVALIVRAGDRTARVSIPLGRRC